MWSDVSSISHMAGSNRRKKALLLTLLEGLHGARTWVLILAETIWPCGGFFVCFRLKRNLPVMKSQRGRVNKSLNVGGQRWGLPCCTTQPFKSFIMKLLRMCLHWNIPEGFTAVDIGSVSTKQMQNKCNIVQGPGSDTGGITERYHRIQSYFPLFVIVPPPLI